MKKYKIDIRELVNDFISGELDSDIEENKEHLEKLTEGDIENIIIKVWEDSGITEYIDNTINWYVYHYKTKEDENES
jgi:hypothetical protein